MIPARQIFESFISSSPAAPPPDPIDAAQVRLAAWEAGQPIHRVCPMPVTLGIGEECGELADFETPDAIFDAVGDVAVYWSTFEGRWLPDDGPVWPSIIRLPARLVPASEADADPASRGPIGGGS